MKKIKLFMPMMVAALLIFMSLNVQAAEKKQLAAGTKNAKVTMTLNALQSFEGEFICKASEKKSTITLKSISAKTSGSSSAMYSTSGNKIFMVGTGDAVDTTIELELEFSQDGKYTVILDGGKTDKNGKYVDYSENSKKSLEELTIIVGAEKTEAEEETEDDEDEEEKEKETSSTEKKTTTTKKRATVSKKSEEEADTTITEKAGKNKVDYSALEKALEDANNMIKSDKDLKQWQSLINSLNNGTMLLDSDDQDQVNAAAEELQNLLAKMNPSAETEKKVSSGISSNLDFSKVLKAIIPILGIAALVGAAFWLWKKAQKKPVDYDGAPMIDYDIGEDDDIV